MDISLRTANHQVPYHLRKWASKHLALYLATFYNSNNSLNLRLFGSHCIRDLGKLLYQNRMLTDLGLFNLRKQQHRELVATCMCLDPYNRCGLSLDKGNLWDWLGRWSFPYYCNEHRIRYQRLYLVFAVVLY
jgi:hypothetical protein